MNPEEELKKPIFKQQYFKISNREDGLLLKVHHSAPGMKGDIRRTQFKYASFSCCNELLALADHRGNIYIVDLANSVFWFLGKKPSVSLLCFHSHEKNNLFVGTGDTNLILLNAETNRQLGSLIGHTEPPTKLSFSSNGDFCLSAANTEGFIWDLQTLSQAHRLNLQSSMTIKQAIFMPVSNNILACFQDDAIHIWAFQSFQCIKQIIPDSWKGHSIQSIAFSRTGQAMVVGGSSRQLVIFTVDDWDAQRVVTLPDIVSSVIHIEFLSQPFDSGANQLLLVLADSGLLLLADVSKETCVTSTIDKDIRSFTCSLSGKYVVCNTQQGEAKIFSGSKLLANVKGSVNEVSCSRKVESPEGESGQIKLPQIKSEEVRKRRVSRKQISKPIPLTDVILDVNRLRPILKEFNEYPDQYRGLIWRSILQLPANKEPWKSLFKRPLHTSAQFLAETNKIQNKVLMACLQSVISCLAHWSPVFGELPYLPNFLFPFIKIFHSDKFVCFEVAVTLIVNWCQHWFEYLSFPPVNILSLIENLLTEHDSILVSVFCDVGITSRQYAWTLLSSAFSEVLTAAQWKQLWDHVISNPPWFLLFAVVAYNISCRSSLKTCTSKKDFEFFFRNQNPIDMKFFLRKCYELMEQTSEENHPKQFFKTFSPLPKGNYPVFSEFPKYIVNYQKEQRDAICKEEEKILKEQHRILSQRLAREQTRMQEKQARAHEARLLEAEKAAKAALDVEEQRLIEKRRELIALRREMRLQDELSAAAARAESMEHQVKQRSAELDRLHNQLYEKAKQSGLDNENIYEEIHEQFISLNVKKQELKDRLSDYNLGKLAKPFIENIPGDEVSHLKEQQRLLSEEIQKLRKENSNQGIKTRDVDVKIAEMDSLHQRVEIALARRALAQEQSDMYAHQCQEESHAAERLKKLQDEVEVLTQQLASTSRISGLHTQCKNGMAETRLLSFQNKQSSCSEPSQPGTLLSLRGSEFHNRERNAVSSAMEARKSVISSWNTT